MKYTKDITNRLISVGFKQSQRISSYKYLIKDDIQVLIVPNKKAVFISLKGMTDTFKGIESIEDLNTIHRLIYGKTAEKFINNEEGD